MDLALELARRAGNAGEVPVGALITRSGEILATAMNRVVAEPDPTAHAEIEALRAASSALGNYRLEGTTLYVTLEPCAMCAGAMVHARIERLVFACRDPKAGAAGSLYTITNDRRLNHAIDVTAGVRSQEASRLLRDFFAARRGATGSGHAIPKTDISL